MMKLEHNIKKIQTVTLAEVNAIGGPIRGGKTTIANALQFAIEKKIRTSRFGQDLMSWAAPGEENLYSRISGTLPGSSGMSSASDSSSEWSVAAHCDKRGTGKYGVSSLVTDNAPQLMLLMPAIDRIDGNPLSSRSATTVRSVLDRFGGDATVEAADWMVAALGRIGIKVEDGRLGVQGWLDACAGVKAMMPPRGSKPTEESEDPDEEDEAAADLAGMVDPEAVLTRFRDGALTPEEALRQLYAYADSTARFRRATDQVDLKALSDATKLLDKLGERLVASGPADRAVAAINSWLKTLDMQARIGPKLTWEVEGADKRWHSSSVCGSEEKLFKLAHRMAWVSMGSIVVVDDGELGPLQHDPAASKQWMSGYAAACLERGALSVLFVGVRPDAIPVDANYIEI